MADETFELQLDTVGAEAVQQTLDALGVQVEQVNAAASSEQGSAAANAPLSVAGDTNTATSTPIDLAPLLAALDRQTEILERIATLLENRPVTPAPTY